MTGTATAARTPRAAISATGTTPAGTGRSLRRTTAAVERHAGQLARSQALRGADAVHLASALALADPDLIIAVWDPRLHAGAASAELRVAPAPRQWAHPCRDEGWGLG